MACCMGPVLSMCCKKFGSVLAAIAHGISVVMLLILWEVMFFLEGFVFAKALLGMIAAMAVQRFIYKLIIALALTREFKSDTSNIAFWTGKWYSMGWHSVSQPAREFLCKITELGMFAGDFVLGHVILFVMLPVIAIPHVDKAHSVMLFWLRPSRQIRPPIYSMKQSKLRKRRVWRYAVLYFAMLVLFLALVVGPIVASSQITNATASLNVPMQLLQPVGLKNNDTRNETQTGTGAPGYSNGAVQTTSGSSAATAKVRLF
jgi:1,3-beta-glucan synthase